MQVNLVRMTNKGLKVVQGFDKAWKAAKALSEMDAESMSQHAIVPVVSKSKVKTVKAKRQADLVPHNNQDVRKYRESTLSKIESILSKGKDRPRYTVYAHDASGQVFTVGQARTSDGAKYLRRKARGFSRRVLRQVMKFRIVKA